jgi:hypothetical protein
VIQLLVQAGKAGEKVALRGPTPHFQEVFLMAGIGQYTTTPSDDVGVVEMDWEAVAGHLRSLEEALLRSDVRGNAEAVQDLLAEEFREFGSSGRVYSRDSIVEALQIEALQTEIPKQLLLESFEARRLASDLALVTYRALSEHPRTAPVRSLRSSLWVFRRGRWQMLFHQGTRME